MSETLACEIAKASCKCEGTTLAFHKKKEKKRFLGIPVSVGRHFRFGQKVKIHMITPATGKERGDVEIKDYVVLQKPQEQADRLPPPRTLIFDFTMTHTLHYDSDG